MLRKVCLTAALATCVAAPAFAQGSMDTVNWTGPYVGINLGYGGGTSNYPYSGSTAATGGSAVTGKTKTWNSGMLGGGTLGYNYEMPSGYVFGLETDLDGTDINGGVTSAGLMGSSASVQRQQSSIDYLGTVRGRVGKTFFNGRFLPYVTGGLAYGDVNTTSSVNCPSCGLNGAALSSASGKDTGQTGYTVGAGAEYALTKHLSFKAEYLYVNLGRQTLDRDTAEVSVPGANIYNVSSGVETTANIMRVGLNYRF
jgi:outer membrane immunogenic protein